MHFCNIVCAARTPKTATSGAFSARRYHFFFSLEKKYGKREKTSPLKKMSRKSRRCFPLPAFGSCLPRRKVNKEGPPSLHIHFVALGKKRGRGRRRENLAKRQLDLPPPLSSSTDDDARFGTSSFLPFPLLPFAPLPPPRFKVCSPDFLSRCKTSHEKNCLPCPRRGRKDFQFSGTLLFSLASSQDCALFCRFGGGDR